MTAFENRSSQKIKVCCFCERWESGGIESFLTNIIQHMDLNAIQVDIIASSIGESVFTDRLRKNGVRFRELSGSQRKLLQNYRLFCCLLAQEHYDVVHLNIFHGLSLYYNVLAKRAGVPVRIAHSHNTGLRRSLTLPAKLLIHKVAQALYTNAATDLWACSEAAAEFLFSKRELTKKSYQFIPNGIDIARFRFDIKMREMIRKELGLENKFVVGNVGRLCYQKNQNFLLDVFHEFVKRGVDSILLLVGEGSDKSELEEKARRLGIEGRVVFYGAASQLERLYWAMDAYVMPSRFEGLPVTSIEAQASGLPCLFSSEITTECVISLKTEFLSIETGPARWAETLLTMRRTEITADPELSNRFEIRSVAETIKRKWLERKREVGTV